MSYKILVILSFVLIFTGCITVNVPLGSGDTAPSFQWQIQWDPPTVNEQGNLLFVNSLRIKDLDAYGSYQISSMVIKHQDGTVVESLNNRWVNRPGAMLSECLARDLLAYGNYPAIFRTTANLENLLTVEGYVREFGATQIDSLTWVAVFDVDVTLFGSRGSTVLLQKNYRYERRLSEPGFQQLAEQLSMLGALWAENVISDFNEVLPRR